jgi:type II secretory pathway pseudopilin PulG
MKLMIMPKEITWWAWTLTAVLLAVGLVGFAAGFIAATALSVIQTVVFLFKTRSFRDFTLQIRLAYSLLLIVCAIPVMRWLYWLPAVGTSALILFGYCLTARVLSLLPWNRTEKLTLNLLRRTFLSPPVAGNMMQGLPSRGCPGGVCSLEAKVAQLNKR